jgi:short-subunit dehydrogenase
MAIKLKPLRDQVMVITGASSGIGLATARAAARQGAKLVLTARNEESLQNAVNEINATGGRAVHVAADIADRNQVQQVADAAVRHFGGFDTWVNVAGISIYGRLQEVSDEDHHRLFETNFWGIVYASRIAVAHLKQRGGALINIGSVASDVPMPLQGMYVASKHAVKGFTNVLRLELQQEGAPVSVTLIKPAGINTPFPHHAKNYLDHEPKLPPPAYQPEEVAYAILHAATHPEREIFIGSAGKMMSTFQKLSPKAMEWVSRKVMTTQQYRNEPPRRRGDALYGAGRDGLVHGDQPGYVMKKSLYTRASLRPVLAGALLAGAGLLALAYAGRGRIKNRLVGSDGTSAQDRTPVQDVRADQEGTIIREGTSGTSAQDVTIIRDVTLTRDGTLVQNGTV